MLYEQDQKQEREREMKASKGRALVYEEIFVEGKTISPHTHV